MLTFLFFAFSLAALALGGVFALPFVILGAVLWIVFLPIKLLLGFLFGGVFRLVFGTFGALFGLLIVPLVLVVGGIALVAALALGLFALVTPLIPVILLALLGWGIYKASRRSAPVIPGP